MITNNILDTFDAIENHFKQLYCQKYVPITIN